MENQLPAGNWGQESAEETAARQAAYKNVDYLTLAPGPNKIRFLGAYIFRHMHYYEGGKRPHIVCLGAEICPICKLGFTTNFYYYCNVLDRADDKVKILRFGSGVKKQLDIMAKKYGDLTKYDIEIIREGKGKDTRYPSVLPELMSSKPIAEQLMRQIEDTMQDLGEIYKIPTLQEVQDAMQPKGTEDSVSQSANQNQQTHKDSHNTGAGTSGTGGSGYSGPGGAGGNAHQHKEPPAGLTTDTGEITPLATGRMIKACYGDEKVFNPQRQECIACPLFHKGCKRRVLAFYTGEKMPD